MGIGNEGMKIISLIGMTGVGKTTVGRAAAKRLNYIFLDLDEIIADETKKTPHEIFDVYGEAEFRRIESEQLKKIFENFTANKNHGEVLILSCGGGIILRAENNILLKKYSYVVWLDRPVEEIMKSVEVMSRPPINGDINNYISLKNEREILYSSVCDLKIEYRDTEEAIALLLSERGFEGL